MEDMRPKLTIRDVFGYMLAYMCWIITAAAGLLALLQARQALNSIWPVLGSGTQWRWILRPVDRFGLVLMGLLWLVYVIFVEQHYRDGITLVRTYRFKARTDPSSLPAPARPQGWLVKMLHRLGLDILATRVLPTLMLPLVLFVIGYLIQQLGWLLIQQAY
jgi:hypothetical protein